MKHWKCEPAPIEYDGETKPDYEMWENAFPEFGGFLEKNRFYYFWGLASAYLDDGPCSLIPKKIRRYAFDLLVAHLALLNLNALSKTYGPDGKQIIALSPSLVGRINSATEGSVSIGTGSNFSGSGTEEWYALTQYGLEYWNLVKQYIRGLYVAEVPPRFPRRLP